MSKAAPAFALPLALFALLCAISCTNGSSKPADNNTAGPSEAPAGSASMSVLLEPAAEGESVWLSSVSLGVLMPKVGLRRIAPGIIPDSIWFEDSDSLGNGSWLIRNLPVNTHVLLQLVIAGGAASEPAAGAIAQEPVYLHLPVTTGEQGQVEFSISLDFTEKAGQLTAVEASVRQRSDAALLYSVLLDIEAATVARDSDGDGDFAEESALPDAGGLGISRSLLARLEAANLAAGTVQSALYTAILEEASVSRGELSLTALRRIGSDDTPAALALARFAEDSAFVLRTVSPTEEKSASTAPSALAGRQVTFRAVSYGADKELWLESLDALQLELPENSIVAVPSRSAARAGEPVPVTVYANRTQRPLHAVEKLRISFNGGNRFRPGSLDPGARGGGAELADGAWVQLGQSGFALPAEERLTSSPLNEKRDYIEISLAPLQRREVAAATGELCNFELICHSDTALAIERDSAEGPVSLYSSLDGAGQAWDSYISSGAVQVEVSGLPLELTLARPAPDGEGSLSWRPLLCRPGESVNFRLVDPLAGDVTSAAETEFFAYANGGLRLELPGGLLSIPPDFRGMLHVLASHRGVYCRPSSEKWIFVDSLGGFRLDIHEKESYIFGGSAAGWALNAEPVADGLRLLLRAVNADNLHACYFTLQYDSSLYRPAGYSVHDPLQAEGSVLLLPETALLARADEGIIEFGFCQLNPQSNPGMNGALDVLDIHFERRSVGPELQYSSPPPGPPELPSALLSPGSDGQSLLLSPYISGDYNQDGEVSITSRDRQANCDLTVLAICFGQSYSSNDELPAVVDLQWDSPAAGFSGDGTVDIWSITPLMREQGRVVQEWQLFYGAEAADYPASGQLLKTFSHGDYLGDPASGRISYEWRSGGALPAGHYWAVPRGLGRSGAPGPPLTIE